MTASDGRGDGTGRELAPGAITRIVLRPVASSLPLGFLAFGAGTMLLTGACRFALTGLYEAAIGGTGLEKASGWIGHQIEQAESEPGIRRQL